MSPRIDVILCTRDPRPAYLRATLRALAAQDLADDLWNFTLVDNGSRDDPRVLVEECLRRPFEVLREPVPGLTPARLRGIADTRAPILLFVDDDNVLAPDYLSRTMEIADRHPFLGAWGGQLLPRFDEPPPAWTRPYLPLLALRALDRDRWSNLPDLAWCPWGAGMVVRREVAEAYRTRLAKGGLGAAFDRAPGSLGGSGDLDLALTSLDLGLGHGLFRALKLEHLMPPERLRESYLLRLAEGGARTDELLRLARGLVSPAPASRGFRERLRDWLALPLSPPARRFAPARQLRRLRAHREWHAASARTA